MSATLFKEVSYSLAKLLEDIEMGEIGLPDIQRPFVWKNAKVRDLFDSMYKGFPVGYLLFWANGLPNGHRQIGSDAKQRVPRLLIVDGQQRLTSLFAVLKGREIVRDDYSRDRINIAFRPSDGQFEVADAAICRDPEFIADISILWSKDVPRNRLVKDFIAKLRDGREVPDDEEDHLCEQIDRLYDLQSYPFTALELSATVDEQQVADVFVRINSQGITLNQADFILTLMSVFWDEGRSTLEQFARLTRTPSTRGPSPFNYHLQPDPDQMLRVSIALGFRRARLQHAYNVLRGKDLSTGEFSEERRDQQFETLQTAQDYALDIQHWHDFHKALVRAGYRQKSMITSSTSALYAYAFFLIGKRDFGVDAYVLRNVIARWHFMVALTGRYTGSLESAMEEDLARLREVTDADGFVALLDALIRAAMPDDYWTVTLPSDMETSAARTPALFAYYAALNLLDARVLFSKLKVSELLEPGTQAMKSPIERHHLFPKGYLRRIGVDEVRDTNQVANFALVEWVDNIDVSDRSPSDY
ncbi:MAG: DUF262 domain-containing protein, partial [Dehalococcoidia bacterium]|nr:DUF262 domain-containing protein [Dehalococcoidia bacterium]